MWQQIQQSLVQSIERVITKIVTLLPGIVAFVLALIIFAAISWVFAMAIRRLLIAIRFDERLSQERSSLAEWSPGSTPTVLVVRTVFWCGIIIGVLVGVSAFEAASAEAGISAYIFGYVPRVVGAAILLFAGNIIARFLSRTVLISGVNMNLQYARLLSLGVKWLVLVLTAAMVLDHLAIGGQIVDLAFGILFGGIVLALSLSVGLGSRELVTRSLEREASRPVEVPTEERKIHHF
ncbi:mechanosensitive ion channel family protein [Acidipila rosea]|uniref:Putative transporter (Transmembrane protein) n=1 Tax=Acidipila rosea TaxID=768535 RepID=A0A4R1LC53_9BACT|nr:hypothetical protein [Acidipila rosea]MBW4025876.1 hypothetical protein [Acidobacteriota bacterium]MBW4044205.1 hypothetical protein [Acidobacteriota bacterium]TCK75764.1 putative transporter (transmembrane protein) [Acidipila rosea]